MEVPERSPLTYDEMFDKVVRSPRLSGIHSQLACNAPKDLGGLVYIAAGLGYHPISPTDTDHSMAKVSSRLLKLTDQDKLLLVAGIQ